MSIKWPWQTHSDDAPALSDGQPHTFRQRPILDSFEAIQYTGRNAEQFTGNWYRIKYRTKLGESYLPATADESLLIVLSYGHTGGNTAIHKGEWIVRSSSTGEYLPYRHIERGEQREQLTWPNDAFVKRFEWVEAE